MNIIYCGVFYVELSYIFAFGMLKIKAKVTHNVFESMFSTIFLEIERLVSYGLYTLYRYLTSSVTTEDLIVIVMFFY